MGSDNEAHRRTRYGDDRARVLLWIQCQRRPDVGPRTGQWLQDSAPQARPTRWEFDAVVTWVPQGESPVLSVRTESANPTGCRWTARRGRRLGVKSSQHSTTISALGLVCLGFNKRGVDLFPRAGICTRRDTAKAKARSILVTSKRSERERVSTCTSGKVATERSRLRALLA
jgi:hypothetical protein